MLNPSPSRRRGYTLVELLVVLIAVPIFLIGFPGWLTMLMLGARGYSVGFWTCWWAEVFAGVIIAAVGFPLSRLLRGRDAKSTSTVVVLAQRVALFVVHSAAVMFLLGRRGVEIPFNDMLIARSVPFAVGVFVGLAITALASAVKKNSDQTEE
jgi:prepilin-type N-terminal cleavage/methylation domain-containing protein